MINCLLALYGLIFAYSALIAPYLTQRANIPKAEETSFILLSSLVGIISINIILIAKLIIPIFIASGWITSYILITGILITYSGLYEVFLVILLTSNFITWCLLGVISRYFLDYIISGNYRAFKGI